MITQSDSEAVYREDRIRPYYSIQGGRRIEKMGWREYRRRWIWGHFSAALKRALEAREKTGAH